MKVIVIQKGSFNVTTLESVTNIAYSSGSITISYGVSQSATYAAADYMLLILV